MIDYWSCRVERPIHTADLLSLTHLYQPLVGVSATALYMTLSNQLNIHGEKQLGLTSQAVLMGLLSLSEKQLLEARYLLEGVGLLNTYHVKDDRARVYHEYELIPPLTPKRFFQSDVLNLALYRQLGREKFLSLRESLLPRSDSKHQKKDVTKSFQEVFTSISPQEIAQYAIEGQESFWTMNEEIETYEEGKYPQYQAHDLEAVRLRLGSRIPNEEWTDQFKQELNEICFLYQLNEWGLLKALQNPEVTQNGKIDLERLQAFVREEYYLQYGGRPVIQKRQNPPKVQIDPQSPSTDDLTEEEKHFKQLEQISPIELLSFYQEGAKIPDSDLRLVESLVNDYALPHGVVNVLLEYVLYKNDYKLPKALVQKIAGHWKRLRIQTVQEALTQARKEKWESRTKTGSKQKIRTSNKQSTRRNQPHQAIPQAVLEQMSETTATADPTHHSEDWMKKRAQINEKLALWEKRKKRM